LTHCTSLTARHRSTTLQALEKGQETVVRFVADELAAVCWVSFGEDRLLQGEVRVQIDFLGSFNQFFNTALVCFVSGVHRSFRPFPAGGTFATELTARGGEAELSVDAWRAYF
jgi:hypothetical protein